MNGNRYGISRLLQLIFLIKYEERCKIMKTWGTVVAILHNSEILLKFSGVQSEVKVQWNTNI